MGTNVGIGKKLACLNPPPGWKMDPSFPPPPDDLLPAAATIPLEDHNNLCPPWPRSKEIFPRFDHAFIGRRVYTGNFTTCVRSSTLETIYMDKNLAPGSAEGSINPDLTRTSTHQTEETQNHQDDLCHDILTGKILPPAPLILPAGTHTFKFVTDDSRFYHEGRK